MNDTQGEHVIYVCSDSVGETAEAVVKATIKQFAAQKVKVKRFAHISREEEIVQLVEEAAKAGSFIAFTLVQPELREMMKRESIRMGIRTVDVMGPMMQAFVDTFQGLPLAKPGLLHQMDDDYFNRVEAVEFAVKYDDGKDPKGLIQADIVLIGVSRTSKTPLSIFLAHKGLKVANLPLIPEVRVPRELYLIEKAKVYGLTMQAERIHKIRKERLKAMGLDDQAKYASLDRIQEELAYAHSIFQEVGCKVIDVSERAIEETAGMILEAEQNLVGRK
ncbi:pyruvate, water dikinase regulatory protein [Marinicrinis lubricantis]|uniref:Putative pyruvate, phosphate dikinase regulatory protein n=1 Tax=Marinicrinis lubricantis TaxID=2086470 RepID=A0ABW1IL70_9BACL